MRRTATSRTSFWLLLVHCRALRIGGSLAPSNFTAEHVSHDCTWNQMFWWRWAARLELTVDDGTNDLLRYFVSAGWVGASYGWGEGVAGSRRRGEEAYLVDLAITNAGGGGKAAGDGGSEGRGSGNAPGGRRSHEGWPGAGKGLDAAAGRRCQLSRFRDSDDVNMAAQVAAQLASTGRRPCRKAQEGTIADLLNILADIEERLLMGVEVGA